jgi:hypothetical protein
LPSPGDMLVTGGAGGRRLVGSVEPLGVGRCFVDGVRDRLIGGDDNTNVVALACALGSFARDLGRLFDFLGMVGATMTLRWASLALERW